jgi:BTB/POZ domain
VVNWTIVSDVTKENSKWNSSAFFNIKKDDYLISLKDKTEKLVLRVQGNANLHIQMINYFQCFVLGDENQFIAKAFHEGQVVEMTKLNGLWQPVEWPNTPVSSSGPFQPEFKQFRLLIHHPSQKSNFEEESPHFFNILDESDSHRWSIVQFVVGGVEFSAHFGIVSSSPVIAAMFESGHFQEGTSRTVHINDIDPQVFEQMLRFMYSGRAPKLEELVKPLFHVADYFQFRKLKEKCEEHLSSKLTTKNVIRRLVMAHQYSASDLWEAALAFIMKHEEGIWFRQDWKQLGQTDYDVFFKAVQQLSLRKAANLRLMNELNKELMQPKS